MKRPYLTYLLAVVLPSALAVAAILAVARSEWAEVLHASDARVAHILVAAFEQDLGGETDSLVANAAPTSGLDTTQATVGRALVGDTVTGLRTSGASPEVFVLAPPADGDPAASVRFASAPLEGDAPGRIGRATGYALSLYLNGRRWASTEEPAGPETLPAPGAPRPAGALAALGGGTFGDATIVALARRHDRVPGPVPVPLVLTIALLLLFAALSGWIQISGRPRGAPPRRSRTMVLLALVPALTAGAFMIQMDWEFDTRLRETSAEDLSRALASASVRGVTASAEEVHRLTGFDATIVRGGEVVQSTLAGPAPAVAALPEPPASLTVTGRVVNQRGPSAYAAHRTDEGAFVVVTAPEASAAQAHLQRRARTIGIALAGWLFWVGVVYAMRGRRLSA